MSDGGHAEIFELSQVIVRAFVMQLCLQQLDQCFVIDRFPLLGLKLELASDHRLEIRVYLVSETHALLAVCLCPRSPLFVNAIERFPVKSTRRSHSHNPFLGGGNNEIVFVPFATLLAG